MFTHNLQIQFSQEEREAEFVLPAQVLCLRQTAATLEILRELDHGRTDVIVIEGLNLGALRRMMLRNAEYLLHTGPYGPSWARCFVTRIYGRLGWTRPSIRLGADPNPLPLELFEFESGLTRDVWNQARMDRFCVARGNAQQFLFQFWTRHAYKLTTLPEMFLPMLRALKASNMEAGMVNRFSTFADDSVYPNSPAVDRSRHIFADITYVERDLSGRSEWNIILDHRHRNHRPQMVVGIET